MPVKIGLKYIDIWKTDLDKEVVAYENEHAEKGQIVFYGPSHFTRWSAKFGNKPMREVLLGKSGKPCVVNRGFGSSCSEHQLYFYPRMIRPLEPSVLVYMSHGNSAAFGYTPEETWEIAQRVIAYTMTDFPEARICLCGAFPAKNMDDEQLRVRKLYSSYVREFAENNDRCFFIDPMEYQPLLDPAMFLDDGVHLNADGYERFAEFMKDGLKDELDKF